MRAVVFAYHDVGCAGLRALLDLGVQVARVYTHDDDPDEDTWFSSVRALCSEAGVPAVTVDPNDPAEVLRLRALRPDALFSFYFRNLLSKDVLAVPRHAAVNLHGSLLPRYRGRAPVNWMLLHGEREGGVTLHHMVVRADAGDIVDQERFPIGPDDRPTDVYAQVVAATGRVITRSARDVLTGRARRIRQLASNATKFGRRGPDDGRLDFHHAAEDVRNLVRAVTRPYPGAFAYLGPQRVAVWWTRHETERPLSYDLPGTLRHVDGGVVVVCADGRALRLVDAELPDVPGSAAAPTEHLPDGAVLTGHPSKEIPWTS